jgi:hypothetical protein
MGVVVQFPSHRARPVEVDKRTLAHVLGRSVRWINYRVAEGMPSRLTDRGRMFLVPEVREWLRKEGFGEKRAG